MTQQPFSRPGAIDLSGLKAPAPQSAAPAARRRCGAGRRLVVRRRGQRGELPGDHRVVDDRAGAAGVLLADPDARERQQLADDFVTLSAEFEGRFLVGLVDIDAAPAIAQAMQIPSIPLVVAVLDGRPAPLIQDVLPIDELRTALTHGDAAADRAGRHRPAPAALRRPSTTRRDGEPDVDPRYAAAQDALGDGDIDRAVAEYQKLVDRQPRRRRGRGRPGDGQAAAAHPGRRPQRPPGPRPPPTPTTSTPRPWSPTSTCSAATWRTRSSG